MRARATTSGAPVKERAAFTMEVSAKALATFDELAKRRGLSRPKMFAELMAREAQKKVQQEIADQLRRDPTGYGDPEFTEWAAKTRVESAR